MGVDQTLPWGQPAALLGAREGTPTEPEPSDISLGGADHDEPAPSAPATDHRTHCPAGHPYDDGNTYVNSKGWRSCRTCKRPSDRRRRARTAKNLTPEQRTLRSRLGAARLHALHDPKETTRKAREAFAARFERQVDPNGVLVPSERARRVEAARRAYFTQLQLRSSQTRRRH